MTQHKPIKGTPKTPPRTNVKRKQLMRLLYRYKGLLEWELKYLEGQTGPTVSLLMPRDAAASVTAAAEAESTGGKAQILSVRQRNPGELDNSCIDYPISYPGSTESDTDLIDTVTPYARALTELL